MVPLSIVTWHATSPRADIGVAARSASATMNASIPACQSLIRLFITLPSVHDETGFPFDRCAFSAPLRLSIVNAMTIRYPETGGNHALLLKQAHESHRLNA